MCAIVASAFFYIIVLPSIESGIPRPKVQISHLVEQRTRKKRIIILRWFLTSQEPGTCSWRHSRHTSSGVTSCDEGGPKS